MSDEVEEVGEKIDRLNSVIFKLMSDLNLSRNHSTTLSMMSIHSFNENFDLESLASDSSKEEFYLPQQYLDKFQESLTEIDRVGMKLEDILSERLRTDAQEPEILLSKAQIQELLGSLSKALENSEEFILFKLTKTALVTGKICLTSQDSYRKQSLLEVENINLRSQVLSMSVGPEKKIEKTNSFGQCPFEIQAELELKQIEFSKKEQEFLQEQEELGYKSMQLEMLMNDYNNKIEDLKQGKFTHIRSPSQDATRAKSTLSMFSPISTSNISSFFSNRQEIEKKIEIIEKMIKKKYEKKRKHKKKNGEINGIFEAFREREQVFKKKIEIFGSFPAKEKLILKYLDEQTRYLHKKIEELRTYETFLQDTWVSVNGNPSGIEAVKKATNKNFQRAKELQEQEEILNQKTRRLQKLKETIKSENSKLQNHRKKILIERQKYLKQQADIDHFLKTFRNFTKNINS